MLVGTQVKYHIAVDGTVTCVEGTDLRTATMTTFFGSADYIPFVNGPWDGWRITYHPVTTILEELTVVKAPWYGAFGLPVTEGSVDEILSMGTNGISSSTQATTSESVYHLITNITAVGTPQPVYVTCHPYKTNA